MGAAVVGMASAQAGHCDEPDLVIVSRTAVTVDGQGDGVRTPASNANALVCAAAPDSEADTRLLAPGSNEVGVRYTLDAGVDHLDGWLDGLGFSHTAIALERHVIDSTGTGDPSGMFVVYDMPSFVAIPDGSGAHGDLVASLRLPTGADVSVVFHTAN